MKMRIGKSLGILLVVLAVGISCIATFGNCKTEAATSQTLWIRLYRIQKISGIPNPSGGQANWNYEIVVSNGEETITIRDEAQPNDDDVLVQKSYSFTVGALAYTTVYIHLWDSFANGTFFKDADISSDNVRYVFIGRYDFELHNWDEYESDHFEISADYYCISGADDGNVDANETDANMWFRIYDGARMPLLGDINSDGKVNMKDVGYVAIRFGIDVASPLWDSKADIVVDGKINMRDIGTVSRHFGEIDN